MDMNYFNPQLDSLTSAQLGEMYDMFLTFTLGAAAVSAFFAFGLVASSALSALFDQSSTGEF